MGWFKERIKAFGHGVEKGIDSFTYHTFGKGIITGREKGNAGVYVGYDSNNGYTVSTPYYGPKADRLWNDGYRYGNSRRNNTSAYSRTTAATAKDIAQGGMTKDEVIDYNLKHPNEIAGDQGSTYTSLNTNTVKKE